MVYYGGRWSSQWCIFYQCVLYSKIYHLSSKSTLSDVSYLPYNIIECPIRMAGRQLFFLDFSDFIRVIAGGIIGLGGYFPLLFGRFEQLAQLKN